MYLNKYNLKNKIALVTGAGKGLGKACAIALAEAGANLVIISRTKKDLDQVSKITKRFKVKCKSYVCDITNYNEIKKIINNQPKIDVLINNAGIASMNHSLLTPISTARKIIETNFIGTFLLCREACKIMKKNNYGRIINFTTVGTKLIIEGEAIYTASKAAIVGMSKSLAIEYAKKNITINCVSPGFIKTKMTDNILENVKAVLTSRIPMARLGTGEDVANTVAFLSSDAASYITGETIHVNGGMYMA